MNQKAIEWLFRFAIITIAVFLVSHATVRDVANGGAWWHSPLAFTCGWLASGLIGIAIKVVAERWRNR